MLPERAVLVMIWLLAVGAVVYLVDRPRWPGFAISLMLCQSISWVIILIDIKLGLFTYPVREFPKATEMGFTMQYMLYPVICGFYILYEPRGSFWLKVLYMLPWTSGITLFHYLLGKYTRLLDYDKSHSFLVWCVITIIFGAVNALGKWFFQNPADFSAEERMI